MDAEREFQAWEAEGGRNVPSSAWLVRSVRDALQGRSLGLAGMGCPLLPAHPWAARLPGRAVAWWRVRLSRWAQPFPLSNVKRKTDVENRHGKQMQNWEKSQPCGVQRCPSSPGP